MNGMNALIRDPRELPHAFHQIGKSERSAVWNLQEKSSSESDHAGTQTFQPQELWEINVGCLETVQPVVLQ